MLQKIWQDRKDKTHVVSLRKGRQQVSLEFVDAEEWLTSFQAIEKRLIEQQQKATFEETFKAMALANIKRPKIIDAAYFKGYSRRSTNPFFVLAGILIVFLLIIILI